MPSTDPITVTAPRPAPTRPRLTVGGLGISHAPPLPLSVLIPTYNYARYLPEAIESVLMQDFQDYELVIADDCSRDDSADIIRRYAAVDKRIRFHLHPRNLGMVANWNFCLTQARGECVQFLFGDDKLADPQALAKMFRLLQEHPSAVLAASARNIIDETSRVVDVMGELGSRRLQDGLEVITRCFESNANLIGEPSVVMFRRRHATRGFNLQYRQIVDLEMWFHLLEKGHLVYTPEPLFSFRRHASQQTAVNRASQIGEREALMLLAEYHARPWFRTQRRRNALFTQIYTLQRHCGFGEASSDLEARLRKSLGRGWYLWFLTLRKLGRPFTNLKRSSLKRLHRLQSSLGISMQRSQKVGTADDSEKPCDRLPQPVNETSTFRNK